MEKKQLKNAPFLDILFDGRNKEYGAYLLRLHYHHRLWIAVGLVSSTVLIFSAIYRFMPRRSGDQHPVLHVTPVEIQKYIPPQKKEQKIPVYASQKPVATKQAMKKLAIPKIAPDAAVDPLELPPKQTDRIRVGPVTQKGLAMDGQLTVPKEMKGVGTGTGNRMLPGSSAEPDIFRSVQVEARYPGGQEAWKKYLQRSLRSQIAVDNGAGPGMYSVVVSFLVAKDGTTSEVRAIAAPDPDYGTAAEAVRVIERSGKWQPAIQNGRSVVYREKQTIIFQVD